MEIPRWKGWPNVLKTQQFEETTVEPMIAHMLRVEEAMMRYDRGESDWLLPRLSQPRQRKLKFYRDEATTRTEDTFEEAAERLGYIVRSKSGDLSSEVKGESLEELVMSITQVAGMGALRSADILVIRHKKLGAAEIAAQIVDMANGDGVRRRPLVVINAGDGAGQHPTQAFVDLATIYQERRRHAPDSHPLRNLTLVMAGDTLFSRTINSLAHLLGRFGHRYPIRIIFCSHPAIKPKPGMLKYLDEHSVQWEIEHDFVKALREADAFYMTRIQEERYKDTDLFEEVVGALPEYSFQPEHEAYLKPHAFVMHPLPIAANRSNRVPEIALELHVQAMQNHPQYVWGRQSLRGIPVRYALLDVIEYGIQQDMAKWAT